MIKTNVKVIWLYLYILHTSQFINDNVKSDVPGVVGSLSPINMLRMKYMDQYRLEYFRL